MSAVRVILLTALAITLVPLPTAQAYSCSTLSTSRTLAGNTVSVLLQNCEDSQTYGTYSQQYFSNQTAVTIDTAQHYHVTVIASNYYYHGSDSSYSYDSTQRYHSYSVQAYDTTGGQLLQGAQVGAGNSQYLANNYGCNEQTGGGAYVGTTQSSGGVGQSVFSGNSPAVLPCTSSDVQNALP